MTWGLQVGAGGRCRPGGSPGASGLCFSQLPYECHLEEMASVGDSLKLFPQLGSRVVVAAGDAPPPVLFRKSRVGGRDQREGRDGGILVESTLVV